MPSLSRLFLVLVPTLAAVALGGCYALDDLESEYTPVTTDAGDRDTHGDRDTDTDDAPDTGEDADADLSDADTEVDTEADAEADTDTDDTPPDDADTGPCDGAPLLTFFADADMDGFGDAADAIMACATPDGAVDNADDCAPGDPDLPRRLYADADMDGHGDPNAPLLTCAQTVDGHVASDDDCNDHEGTIHPDTVHPELVDGIDQNCDAMERCYVDNDGDTWLPGDGTLTTLSTSLDCAASGVRLDNSRIGDCDDDAPLVFPGSNAAEVPADGIDQNCDGMELCYIDADNDEHATPPPLNTTTSTSLDCVGDGVATSDAVADDCDDTHATVYPGAAEICSDGLPNDCASDADVSCPLTGLSSPCGGQAGSFLGDWAAAFFGAAVRVGDVNGDGEADLVVLATDFDDAANKVGKVSIFLGPWSGQELAAVADGSIVGNQGNAGKDWSLAVADVNNDTRADIIIGDPRDDAGGADAGAVHVFYGATDLNPVLVDRSIADPDAKLLGLQAGALLGWSVAAGDFDGDRAIDLLAGAPEHDGAANVTGRAYVIHGPIPPATRCLGAQTAACPEGAASFAALDGTLASEMAGLVVANAGDTDGDGVEDLLIASPEGDPPGKMNAGIVHLVRGSRDRLTSGTLDSLAFLRLEGLTDSRLGAALAGGQDVNGDGLADLLLGAPTWDNGGIDKAGATFLFLSPLAADATLASASATYTTSVAMTETGGAVALGDLNGDGRADVALGVVSSGKTYAFYSPRAGVTLLAGADVTLSGLAAEESGKRVLIIPDIDGDGFGELLVSETKAAGLDGQPMPAPVAAAGRVCWPGR